MKTTSHYLLQNNVQYANKPALSFKDSNGVINTDTWSDYYEFVMSISKSLISYGINKGDRCAIYSYNRKEWFGCYSALQMVNGVAVAVYHTSSPSEVEWVVGNSESKIVFVGNNPNDNGEKEKMPIHRLHSILEKLNSVELVVVMDGVERFDHENVVTWEEFISKGKDVSDSDVLDMKDKIDINDSCSLIYTSGTTGNPKGVELTHNNFKFQLDSVLKVMAFEQGEKYVSWLPLAHVFGQMVDNHYWVRRALHMTIVDSPLNTIDYAKEVQPHLFISVPRIYEKVYANLIAAIESKTILKIGLKIPGLSSILKKKLKEAAGFSNTRFAISGAAPINPDILQLFQQLGIPLFEGYGMTENTAGATLNYHGNNKIGSVGRAVIDTEVKIAEDGEVLIRGDHVMKGYYKNQEATNETIIDGWLHTGDVGKIDDDGFLFITGRMKEIYVSSSGKNVAPLVIEETMKSIPLVSQCYLVGDGRKFCSALITLDMGIILRDKFGVDPNSIPKDPIKQNEMIVDKGSTLSDFTDSEQIFNEIKEKMDEMNLKFSSPEQIKKFTILPRDFSIDDGELTPTLKIRRKIINDNWATEIDNMYSS